MCVNALIKLGENFDEKQHLCVTVCNPKSAVTQNKAFFLHSVVTNYTTLIL